MKKNISLILFLLFSLITASQAAGISVGGTRFVYDDNLREISIPIMNTDKEKPYLIQSWVSAYQGDEKTPFIATHLHYFVLSQIVQARREFHIPEHLWRQTKKWFIGSISNPFHRWKKVQRINSN